MLKRSVVRHFLQRGETEFKTTQQYHQEIMRIIRDEGSSVTIGHSTLKKWSMAHRFDTDEINDNTKLSSTFQNMRGSEVNANFIFHIYVTLSLNVSDAAMAILRIRSMDTRKSQTSKQTTVEETSDFESDSDQTLSYDNRKRRVEDDMPNIRKSRRIEHKVIEEGTLAIFPISGKLKLKKIFYANGVLQINVIKIRTPPTSTNFHHLWVHILLGSR